MNKPDARQKMRENELGQVVEDHGGNFTPDRIEANEWRYWEEDAEYSYDRGDLIDDGRSGGYGESYAERNA